MKKIVLACLSVCLIASAAIAMPSGVLPYGASAKIAGMGGAGSAIVDDIAAAYYNPAGMARAQAVALKLGAAYTSQGSDKLMNVLGNISNPAKFLADNFSQQINVKGSVNAIVGFDVAKTGISVIPVTYLELNKNKNEFGAGAIANLNSDSALTMGYGVGVPYLGDINIGFNAKYIYNATADASVAAGVSTTDITNTVNSYSGFGLDIGMQGKTNVVPTMPISFALVYKDLFANLKGTQAKTKGTFNNSDGSQSGPMQNLTPSPLADVSVPTTLVIGAATEIPLIGAKLAVDLDSVSSGYSVTHIGLEYPILMKLVALRIGSISGGNSAAPVNMMTYGIGVLADTVNLAFVSDNNNSTNNKTMVDVHIGF
ncbi:MAG: hypothetical protein NTZ10_06880 [Candidatus Saganbacteria bacterium]|nr:hypothetical protein [Candidatus Saganbacteria bacterium]